MENLSQNLNGNITMETRKFVKEFYDKKHPILHYLRTQTGASIDEVVEILDKYRGLLVDQFTTEFERELASRLPLVPPGEAVNINGLNYLTVTSKKKGREYYIGLIREGESFMRTLVFTEQEFKNNFNFK